MSAAPAPTRIDVRGPRFGAAITTVVLALALALGQSPIATVLVAWQTFAFGLGALVGLHAQPYSVIYRRLVQPRLAAPTQFEDAAPPRFAQAVGLAFAVVALVSLLVGATAVATVALVFALIAAFLNAVFGLCLGCQMYLMGRRIATR